VDALRASGRVPERIITTHHPSGELTASQWDYEGVLENPEESYGQARDRWIRQMGGKPIFSNE